MEELQLEINKDFAAANNIVKIGNGASLMFTPPLDEDYWLFRVKLHEDQAIVTFPKFSTFGIGFAQEEDWNTNLPYTCDAQEIYNHIKHNKQYDEITDEQCLAAIKLVQDAVVDLKKPKCHTPEMLAILKDTYEGDLTACYVYGSPMRPMSATWARIPGATFLNADKRATGYHTYVATLETLPQETINSYELVFVSQPE